MPHLNETIPTREALVGTPDETLLMELVSRYSPSMQEGEAVRYLVGWMGAQGFHAWVDEAGNACGMRGRPDAPHLLILLGHIDTVTGDIPVRIEDGKLYGRGSVDAKGALATFAAATAAATIPDNWRVLVIGAVEEEIATSKGAHFVRACYQPDVCVIGEPSGANRVTLGYKGRLLLEMTYTRPMTHTARPEPSAGAVGAAFWQTLLTYAEAYNQGRERLFDQIQAHLHHINTDSDGFTESVHLHIGFRLPLEVSPQSLTAYAESALPDGATLHVLNAEAAYLGGKNNPLVRGMLSAIRGGGEQPGFVLKTGTSDMNVVGAVWTCPIVAYGPGDSNLDHTPDEHLLLSEYAAAVGVIRRLIEGLQSGNGG